jgi:hypothetical protein
MVYDHEPYVSKCTIFAMFFQKLGPQLGPVFVQISICRDGRNMQGYRTRLGAAVVVRNIFERLWIGADCLTPFPSSSGERT